MSSEKAFLLNTMATIDRRKRNYYLEIERTLLWRHAFPHPIQLVFFRYESIDNNLGDLVPWLHPNGQSKHHNFPTDIYLESSENCLVFIFFTAWHDMGTKNKLTWGHRKWHQLASSPNSLSTAIDSDSPRWPDELIGRQKIWNRCEMCFCVENIAEWVAETRKRQRPRSVGTLATTMSLTYRG